MVREAIPIEGEGGNSSAALRTLVEVCTLTSNALSLSC